MDDHQLLRYSRQILLKQVDVAGQQRLLDSRALIIGLGGLGSPVAMYLAAAGVGHLMLVDFDSVDLTNLQRQIAHTTDRVGQPKVESARETLAALNPDVQVTTLERRLESDELNEQVRTANVVIDASDNFETRAAVNAACVRERTPLVSGAAIGLAGQVSVFHLDQDDEPCYRCVYKETDYPGEACSQYGVFTPVVGMIGATQANEAMKVLLGIGETLRGRLLLLDALTMQWETVRFSKDPNCSTCGGAAAAD